MARVCAGAKCRDVSALASPEGLSGLSGSSGEVGVVGYMLGGGHGWLSRKHGLACNSVIAAEVVTADGRHVRAGRDTEPDLFWALRGGGGSFAVVMVEDALEPWDSGVKYANFIDVPIDTRTCDPGETFQRLQGVKARYDRDDLFRANHAIPCPTAAG